MSKPFCFGYFSPYNKICTQRCSYFKDCKIFQENNLIEEWIKEYNNKKEVNDINVDDILNIIDEDEE